MTPDRKRRDLFLTLIDALLEHVQMNTRMDIRDRIAALALVDRVLARERTDDDAGRLHFKARRIWNVRSRYSRTVTITLNASEAHRGRGAPTKSRRRLITCW
jgi:hypothetical protein